MDTFQWLDAAFARYKANNSILHHKSYSSLCEESNELIDFVPPTGLTVRLDSSYSAVLSKSVSLRLPGSLLRLGVLHYSPPPAAATAATTTTASSFFGPYFMYGGLVGSTGGSGSGSGSVSGPHTIEAYYFQRIGANGYFSLTSSLLTGQARSSFTWDFNSSSSSNSSSISNSNSNSDSDSNSSKNNNNVAAGKGSSLTWSYCSHGRILGWQALKRFTMATNPSGLWCGSWGGEVYYTAQENSGGVSLGLRLEHHGKPCSIGVESINDTASNETSNETSIDSPSNDTTNIETNIDSSVPTSTLTFPSTLTTVTTQSSSSSSSHPQPPLTPVIFTATANPLMGHFRSTLTAPLCSPLLTASCRFDINVNSFDSDLSAGLAYGREREGAAVKVSVGMRSGVAFVMETRLGAAVKGRIGVKAGMRESSIGVDLVINN